MLQGLLFDSGCSGGAGLFALLNLLCLNNAISLSLLFTEIGSVSFVSSVVLPHTTAVAYNFGAGFATSAYSDTSMLGGLSVTGIISNFLGKGLDVFLLVLIVNKLTISSASSAAFLSFFKCWDLDLI